MTQLRRSLLWLRISRTVGLGLFFVALIAYRSSENRQVLGLWSYPWFAILVCTAAILLKDFVGSLRTISLMKASDQQRSPASPYFDFSVFLFGTAYLISAIDTGGNAARVADLNFFGSTSPAAILLEWFSLLALFIATLKLLASKAKSRLTNALLLIGTISVLFLLSEGIVRVRAIIFPVSQGFPTYTTRLWERRYVALNGNGFRDVDHSAPKDKGVHRLLVVGDSFAFGWGINDTDKRFGERLSQALSEKTGEEWEVINASRGDTHTLHHIDLLKRSLPFDPDFIILLYVFNDIDYLSPVSPRGLYDKLNSRFNLVGVLYQNFYVFQEIIVRFRLLGYSFGVREGNKFDPYQDSALMSRHLQDVLKFVELGERNGAIVRVVPFDIDPAKKARYRSFTEAADALGIPVYSLGTAFEGYDVKDLKVNKFDGHPNELANFIASQEISKNILKDWSLRAKRSSETPTE
jgi:hypothetical protein